MARPCKYSCESATQTLEWINAISDFLKPFKSLLNAHVVNFFKDRLWESLDKEWIDCLREESADNLLKIPSGIVQDDWPASLQEFILTLRSLVLPREPGSLQMMLPDLHVASLGSVLAQGMNLKKKHEVEIMSAVVSAVANGVGAQTIIDVGAGQGYLAQVLSFEYQLSVIAIDASSHHGTVTSARGNKHLNVPQAVTCHVLSSDTLKALMEKNFEAPNFEGSDANRGNQPSSHIQRRNESSLVLAGLHACGDLSVTMIRTFLDCKEVKALVSIGCCYNLLPEECSGNTSFLCGFPMSASTKLTGLLLGKNARDLACQSAERWRSLTEDAALQNFEVHAFRAAFQMVLHKYYPEVLIKNPSIGRQGKALRRQQFMRVLQSQHVEESITFPLVTPWKHCKIEGMTHTMKSGEDDNTGTCARSVDRISITGCGCKGAKSLGRSSKFADFEEFSKSGLRRLGLSPSHEVDFLGLWKEFQPFSELVGPYWSIRAALGPLVETFLLLDRLLFLQEQGSSVEAVMLPLFDSTLSPRNVAIIARKI
ncbi:S-adenosyl-L-methionine-dependent methyltransferases superfamily protein isoform X2 [Tasmannia lanceolata]|uniref:S-adenosyl-L-methionine-dependent methyltransferases superfamily protein isoform X2 n=1 Tax=Tasmannia lanceolata TaxID=3420 RepID=UPI004064A1E3